MSAWQEIQYQEWEEELARNEWFAFLLEGQDDEPEEERAKAQPLITSAPQEKENL